MNQEELNDALDELNRRWLERRQKLFDTGERVHNNIHGDTGEIDSARASVEEIETQMKPYLEAYKMLAGHKWGSKPEKKNKK